MQKIRYPYKNDKEKELFLNEYFKKVSSKINNESEICKEIKKINKSWDLKKLLTADFDELIHFVKSANKVDLNNLNKLFIISKDKIIYSSIQRTIADFFIEKQLNIRTCFYCNIEFINPFNQFIEYKSIEDFFKMATEKEWIELISKTKGKNIYNFIKLNSIKNTFELKGKKIKSVSVFELENNIIKKITLLNINSLKKNKDHFTLDHFIPKNSYACFSVSLFNLIPSCYSCNTKFKGQQEFDVTDELSKISPSSKKYDLDKSIEFKLNFNIDKYLKNRTENKNVIDIKVTNLNSDNNIDKFLDMFNLKGRYEFHKSISDDLLNKRKIYSDSQLNEIEKIFFDNKIRIDKETLKKQIFGSVIFEKEDTNEPFEKYKKDIAKQLGLI
jgi:hypothetical protein